MLSDALDSRVISLSKSEMEELPSISRVKRNVVIEGKPLSAEHILRFAESRSIVILNTVERAQKMFNDIRSGLAGKGLEIPVMLLHSRFFKNDRREKEDCLSKQFGKGCYNPSILVATQVVEAGLDISCEHLHTEVCPVNSLVQRAGRCARYPGESGVVHVYDLPEAERAWLPYGDMKSEEPAFSRTKTLLSGITTT